MNIFQTIAGILGENDDVTIVVTKSAGGRLAVSTNFRNRAVTDKARDLIAPFLVSGTPDELDAEYCGIIAEPLEQSSGIQTSMANFEASKKLAQAKSQQASAAKGKAENERLAAEKKARALYEEARKLSDGKRHDEAARKLEEALKTASETDRKKIQDLLQFSVARAPAEISRMRTRRHPKRQEPWQSQRANRRLTPPERRRPKTRSPSTSIPRASGSRPLRNKSN